jgi:hypothetical protein
MTPLLLSPGLSVAPYSGFETVGGRWLLHLGAEEADFVIIVAAC